MRKLSFLVFLFSSTALAAVDFVDLSRTCRVRVISESPATQVIKGDVLFLTGFADRADNHSPLFSRLTGAGFRVISFDYPSHGETDCWNLDFHNFTSLSNIAESLLGQPQFSSDRPLYLTGWSTGGLLAYRMLQRGYFSEREINALVLLAPGLSVYKIPGDRGVVTQESLLSNPNPPHMGPIKPTSPLLYLGFSSSLIANSVLARQQSVPDIPILMILGDDEQDVYADTPTIKSWYKTIRNKNSQFQAVQCPSAKHELDNEIEPIGASVRTMFTQFLIDKTVITTDENCSQL